jgi:ABC-type phosphate/phosphonate transport system substrate-binding protein
MHLTLSYYPDITQKQTDEAVRDAIIVFADAVAHSLCSSLGQTVTVEVRPVMSVPAQFADIVAGGSQIALMKPVAYVLAHRRDPAIVPACVAHRPIDGEVGTRYFAQVYARRELGYRTLSDLASAPPETLRVAYGNRFSTSNFLINAAMMAKAGIHPFLFYRSATFFGGHDLAAEAVYAGEADIGCGHDGVIKILSQSRPDAEDRLIAIGREDIHSDPVVVHTGVLPPGIGLDDIQAACTSVAKTAPVQAALDLFWGWVKDLSPTEHANYRSIEEALQRLSLDERDML